jgi:hypothetical protein
MAKTTGGHRFEDHFVDVTEMIEVTGYGPA